jgi:tetratricopeptide (TPR) repeat protein
MNLAILSLVVLLNASFLVVNPNDLETAFQELKQAETQKDAAQVKALAAKVFTIAHQLEGETAPEDADQKENWTKRMAWVNEVEVHAEYALVTAALQAPPAQTVELLSALETHNPKSKYLDSAYANYLYALHQSGGASKITGVAEKAIVHFPENEDLLLVLANSAYERKQSANALNYARRLVTVLNKHAKPEGYSAPDWERKRSAALGSGYWMTGILLGDRNQYYEADKNLRAALPLIKGDNSMAASAYYYLGLVNYQLGKMTTNKAQVLEAVKFSQQAAALPGPFAQNASHNARVMQNEATMMR